LSDNNVTVYKGTIHSLVGRNGAGKSTLVNAIAGVIRADSGEIIYDGSDISHLTLKERQTLGIRLVTQHASVIPDLNVAENIFLGLWPKKHGLVDWTRIHEHAREVMDEFGLKVDSNALLRNLTPVDQRKVNIIRALFGGGKFIILDEPTTSLSVEDRNNLFTFVQAQASRGITFILISHYLEEVLKVSDDITVLRDGLAFPNMKAEASSHDKLAAIIAGENVELVYREEDKVVSDDLMLEFENFSAQFVNSLSTKIHRGEIVGFVGFPGSGAREICTALYGLHKVHSGKVRVEGKEVRIKEPKDALKYGICYVPNDRHADGIVSIMPIYQNIGLSILRSKLENKFAILNEKKEVEIAEKSKQDLNIKLHSIKDPVSSLSGGNQQKVVLAKVLACEPKVLILDEPTIGIDIKSREEIIGLIKGMTQQGMSAIYITNDYDELLRIADRVVIFNNGNIVADLVNDGLDPETIITTRDKVYESEVAI
jgi:simple sugar transport system ATP-binding protein/ribose transport system ATP-binding protein